MKDEDALQVSSYQIEFFEKILAKSPKPNKPDINKNTQLLDVLNTFPMYLYNALNTIINSLPVVDTYEEFFKRFQFVAQYIDHEDTKIIEDHKNSFLTEISNPDSSGWLNFRELYNFLETNISNNDQWTSFLSTILKNGSTLEQVKEWQNKFSFLSWDSDSIKTFLIYWPHISEERKVFIGDNLLLLKGMLGEVFDKLFPVALKLEDDEWSKIITEFPELDAFGQFCSLL
jgi:hypothetical protein